MSDDLKKRFEFPNTLVQSQAVSYLIAAVIKENVSKKICESTLQTPALTLLWEKCCSDNVIVRSTCCEGLVALVAQDYAEFSYILDGILNLIPSARNTHDLVKAIVKLLQMQALKVEKCGEKSTQELYKISYPPHPLITVLEYRPDCWPVLLQQLTLFFQHCPERAETSCVHVMAPFLQYLYCEPSQLHEYSQLRMGLLKPLFRSQGPWDKEKPSTLVQNILQLFCDLVPHFRMKDEIQVTEITLLLEELCLSLLRHPCFWKIELTQLSFQLLCLSEVSLRITGECASFIHLIEQSYEQGKEDFPVEQAIMGIAVLILQAPLSQQKPLLSLAFQLLSYAGSHHSPSSAQLLLIPVLQIVSSSAPEDSISEQDDGPSRHHLALKLLEMIQQESPKEPNQLLPWKLSFPVTNMYGSLFTTWRIFELMKDEANVRDWLSSIKSLLPITTQVPVHVYLLLAHLLIQENGPSLQNVLCATTEIAKVDSSQVPNLVSVLMFKLGKPLEPELYRDILYTLPALGVHKIGVVQILRIIKILGNTPKLGAIALRLMTSLWEKQDRIYPDLQQSMATSDGPTLLVGKDTQWEKLIAKASSIRDICRHRPYQHGADMLAAISKVLNECTKLDQSTPAALVLQGLHALCQAEVVCIRSVWEVLSPELGCEARPLILKAISELFALVPSLTVNTPEYEKFKAQVVSFLWNHSQSKDPMVASAAYKSLSEFGSEENNIYHLPEKARPEMELEEELNEDEEKEEDLSVPGSSYIKLLSLSLPAVFPALEEFFVSLVKQEMVNMPRGVYHSALRGSMARSDQGKIVAGIPNFMLKMYERNKQPGLKPSLSAGMLLCYDIPIHVDKDGRPINRFLASRGRSFQQTLVALLHEVGFQSSEWHRSIMLPYSWLGFMNRTFHAALQGRQADLDLQLKHGKDNSEELQNKKITAWLWVRDMLTDVIKLASKDNPVVKGNSLLALSSLIIVVSKYESSLSTEIDRRLEAERDFLPTIQWISIVVETLLTIVDGHYHPRGQVYSWFYHKSYTGENTASAIVQSCAAIGLALLVPVFIISFKEKIKEIVNMLTARLPGKPGADESQTVQVHVGLALGMFLARLCEEKVSDISGHQINIILMRSLDMLENCCFDTNLEYNSGCILGVGLVLSYMSHSSQTESRVHVTATLRKLSSYLSDSEGQSRTIQEVLAYSLSCVCISAFSVGIIEAAEAEDVMNKIRMLTEKNQQTPGFALALGNIVHGLSVCGHGKAEDLSNKLLPPWIKIVLTEGSPTMQCLAALNGLVSLVGSEGVLFQMKSDPIQSSQFQGKLKEVIRTIIQLTSLSAVIGVQSNAVWLLGHLHLSSLSTNQSRASVPADFSYLSENSFIRAAIDFLIDGGKKGPESVPTSCVKTVMKPIVTVGKSYQYPPVNWASLLSPLLRLNFGEEVQLLCIQLMVTQAQSSQNAAMLLGMWVIPPLVYSLSVKSRKYLFGSLSLWMKYVSAEQLQVFTKVFIVQHFEAKNRDQNPELCQESLEGLSQAMKLPNPAQHLWNPLCQTAEKIFDILPNKIQRNEVDLYVMIAKCLAEMTDAEVNRIFQITKSNVEKTVFVRVYLISQGRFSLMCLNNVIDAVVECDQRETVAWIILHSFYHARIVSHPNTGVLKRLEWMLELMGIIRSVAYQSKPVQNVTLEEAVDFLFQIFAALVVAWGDHATPLLLGFSASWLSWHKDRGESSLAACSPNYLGQSPLNRLTLKETLTLLPNSMHLLLAKEPWKEQTPKFIDWLFSILESPKEALSASTRDILKATLLTLRFLPEFKRKVVWTRVCGW
ncbi:focadhesin isoform X1 [Tachyglossus aculeatus]|uniref:focadhesin isoform X1 n=1 Tax=Tachyglossus aculeatus TaxID=9261 RepID=UPI0018F3F930|nr:focadhesin isoform X1 [Tachyglossus aculeatus]